MIQVKFINDAGTITYNQDTDVIEIVFDGAGSYQQYLKSLGIARDMARIYHSHTYLVVCHCFMKVSPAKFMALFLRWLPQFAGNEQSKENQHTSIYLTAATHAISGLQGYFSREGLLSYGDVACYLFESPEAARDFIQVRSF